MTVIEARQRAKEIVDDIGKAAKKLSKDERRAMEDAIALHLMESAQPFPTYIPYTPYRPWVSPSIYWGDGYSITTTAQADSTLWMDAPSDSTAGRMN